MTQKHDDEYARETQPLATTSGGFVPWDDSAQEEHDRANEAAEAGKALVFKDNAVTYFRVLPPVRFRDESLPGGWYQMKHPFVELWRHFYDFPGDPDKKVQFVCPLRTHKQRCPLCEDLEPIEAAKPAFKSKEADLLYTRSAKRLLIYQAIDVQLPEAGVRLLYAAPRKSTKKGRGIFECLEELRVNDAQRFWEPDGAPGRKRGVNIAMKKNKGAAKYDVTFELKRAEFVECDIASIGDGMLTAAQWADKALDLRVEQVAPSYQECRRIMQGRDRDEEEDEPPAAVRRSRRGARAQDNIEDDA
jgi:hypothetical protein